MPCSLSVATNEVRLSCPEERAGTLQGRSPKLLMGFGSKTLLQAWQLCDPCSTSYLSYRTVQQRNNKNPERTRNAGFPCLSYVRLCIFSLMHALNSFRCFD
jgi:hypothetical protein